MRRRRSIILLSCASGAALLALTAFYRRPVEPLYEGRPLSSWLDHHVASSAARPPYGSAGWQKAHEAIRAIGTNGIPVLLQMIRAKDPPDPVLNLWRRANALVRLPMNYRPAINRNEEAEYAFEILGTNGHGAVPALIRTYDEEISDSAQRCAAMALGHIGKHAQAALPTLIRRFNHTNQEVRFYAVSAVMNIGGDTNIVFPALAAALQDPFVSIRWNALSGISYYGARARSLAPLIRPMLHDTGVVGSDSITQQVATTLWRIAPEQIGTPHVVAPSASILSNGLTTQAIKFHFLGEPNTLIPPGKAVPTVAQYWSSDPRPRLTIYRGATNSTNYDVLLGHFEVLDVPDRGDNNISTLCIVTDTEIILNARDNNNNYRLLSIRRLTE